MCIFQKEMEIGAALPWDEQVGTHSYGPVD